MPLFIHQPDFRQFFISLVFALLFILSITQSALALTISGVRFGSHPDSQRAVIELSEAADFRVFIMNSPNRVIIDMPTFGWNVKSMQRPSSMTIRNVRFGELGGGLSRIVIETEHPVVIQAAFMLPRQGNQPHRLVVDFKRTTDVLMAASLSQIHGPLQGSSAPPASPPQPEKTLVPPKSETASSFKPLIIIDPGHGGQDPGARGANGAYEKNIVLAVAHELKKQLEDSGQYRVRMTRDKDVFIALRDRVKFARKNGGDLFISLHADSIRDETVTGASVYTLSETASDEETAKLADRENKSDMIAGIDLSRQEKDVADILLDLATRDTMNQSKFLANTIVGTLKSRKISMLERPHRSAGFAVLKAPDIPSILVEMGYLTNKKEVARLSSPEHRRKIAAALKSSVDGYFLKIAARSAAD
jgi:N-acetylmuramoyl-L-alanine amidase